MVTRRQRRNEKRRQIAMSIFLSVILIFSMAGVYFYSRVDDGSFEYNGFLLSPNNQHLELKIEGETYQFSTHPDHAKTFALPAGFMKNLQGAPGIAISFVPNSENAMFMDLLRLEMMETFSVVSMGVVEENSSFEMPYLDCALASPTMPVIILNTSNETKFSGDENCLIFEANQTGFIELRDSLLYNYLGVLE